MQKLEKTGYLVLGFAAIGSAVLDVLGFADGARWSIQAILALCGALLMAHLLLVRRIDTLEGNVVQQVRKIDEALGRPAALLLSMKDVFPGALSRDALAAKEYIIDTNLNQGYPYNEAESPQVAYRDVRDRRLAAHELRFQQVVVIHHRSVLEEVMRKLRFAEEESALLHLRVYEPKDPMPTLHVMSFDGRGYYLGGYHLGEPGLRPQALYLDGEVTNRFFGDYWNYLWARARPLNERGIDWVALGRIARRLGLEDVEFEALKERASKINLGR